MKRSNFLPKISIFATCGTVVYLFLQKSALKSLFLNHYLFRGDDFKTTAKILMDIMVNKLCFSFVHHQHLKSLEIFQTSKINFSSSEQFRNLELLLASSQ